MLRVYRWDQKERAGRELAKCKLGLVCGDDKCKQNFGWTASRPFGGHRHMWEDNIRMEFRRTG
jgi:hypothetical protein